MCRSWKLVIGDLGVETGEKRLILKVEKFQRNFVGGFSIFCFKNDLAQDPRLITVLRLTQQKKPVTLTPTDC